MATSASRPPPTAVPTAPATVSVPHGPLAMAVPRNAEKVNSGPGTACVAP